MSLDQINEQLIWAYRTMAELTKPFCGKCRIPYSCCSDFNCEIAQDLANKMWDVNLVSLKTDKLTFLSEFGCTIEPHLRPFCTLHVCSMNSIGTINSETDENYFNLRDIINKLEYRKNQINKESDNG